jgi:hypothetical protein
MRDHKADLLKDSRHGKRTRQRLLRHWARC